MNTEELQNITSNWQITDQTVTADPAKLKEAFELTQSEIANFWREVEEMKKSDMSAGDQLRKITDLLTGRIQNLPLMSFETDGTFVERGEGGTAFGIIYSGTEKSLEYAFISDFQEKIWSHYTDHVQSIDDFWPLRDLCFPTDYNLLQWRTKTNEANSKIEGFLKEADTVDLHGFLITEEHYSLAEDMPDLYAKVMDLFIGKCDPANLADLFDEQPSKFNGMTQEQFGRLLAKVESADPETKESIMALLEEFRSNYLS